MLFALTLALPLAQAGSNDACGGVIASLDGLHQSEIVPEAQAGAEPVEDDGIPSVWEWGICILAILFTGVILFLRGWWIPPGFGPFWPLGPEVLLGGWALILLSGAAVGYCVTWLLPELSILASKGVTMLSLYTVEFLLIGVIFLMLLRSRRTSGMESKVRSTSMRAAISWGVIGMILVFPIAQFVGILISLVQQHVFDIVPEALAHDTLKAIDDSPGDPWGIVIMFLVVFITPVIEEFSYRGMIQQGFRALGSDRISAILLTSILFVFMHVPALPGASIGPAVGTLFVLSLFLGWLHERTGRLAAPIITHALFNALNLLFFELEF